MKKMLTTTISEFKKGLSHYNYHDYIVNVVFKGDLTTAVIVIHDILLADSKKETFSKLYADNYLVTITRKRISIEVKE